MEARCQCQRVTFPVPATPPLAIVLCHCNRCKLITGSVYNISAVYPYFDFPPTALSNLESISQTSDSGRVIVGHFCRGCGVRMAHTEEGEKKQWVSVSAGKIVGFDWGLLEDKSLTLHCWTKEAVVPVPEGFRIFEGQPIA